MYRKKEMIALMMAFIITVAFMPAFAFAETENASADKTVMNSHEEQYEDTSDTADDGWTPLTAGTLQVYDEEFNFMYSGTDAEEWAVKNRVSYPTSLRMIAGQENLGAYYLDSNIDYETLYIEGNAFEVQYSYGAPETYICKEVDGYSDYYLEGDTSSFNNVAFIYSDAAGEDGLFTYREGKGGNDKGFLFFDTEVTLRGKTYTLRKASAEVSAKVAYYDPSAGIYDSEGRGHTTYTGKVHDIPIEDIIMYPYVLNVESAKAKDGSDLKSIGYHEIEVKFDNTKGYYDNDTVTTGWQIVPKTPTGFKVSNSKKKTLKLSWKYTNKANYKAIDGYKVVIYDKESNLVTEKYLKKTKKSVTITNKGFKKGQRYSVELYAYKVQPGPDGTEDIEWSSDPAMKSVVIKK